MFAVIRNATERRRWRHLGAGAVAGLAVWVLAGIAPARAQTAPDPNELYFFDTVSYGGNGCPAGSVDVAVSEDGLAITLIFDQYSALVGPTTIPSSTKTCTLSLPLHIPPGWQYSIVRVDYRGHVFLDRDVWASQRTEYYFQGRQGPRLATRWVGPLDRDYNVRDRVALESQNWAWSPCNVQRNLNMQTRLQVNNAQNRRGFGQISNDTIDAEIAHIYRLQWRRCR
jgi:hypothetical protein